MARANQKTELDVAATLDRVVGTGEGAPSAPERMLLIQEIRRHSPEAGQMADRALVLEIDRLRRSLGKIRQTQSELREALGRMEGIPWYPGTFLGLMPITTQAGAVQGAIVANGGSIRVVSVTAGLDPETLTVGDQVFLGPEQNVLVGASGGMPVAHGQLAAFDRHLPDGRIVLRYRDEEIVVRMADRLRETSLANGDTIRWDRDVWLAHEKVERSDNGHLFLEDTPTETFEGIGGLDRQIRKLVGSIGLHAFRKSLVDRYCVPPKRSVLLAGPPGTGKTLVARAFANWLASMAPSRRARFINVKPAALHSMWFGQSEAQYRECFRAAREAGDADPSTPCVVFLDEVDSVGESRGHAVGRVNDQVLAALLAELDGLEGRGNVLVVAATNRLHALDPALLRPGRLGDLVLDIPRPDRSGAESILEKYLPPEVPYFTNGHADAAEARRELIASSVCRIYAENDEANLARVRFRDGTERQVMMRDLASGANLANLAAEALERACRREAEGGVGGLRPGDVFEAIVNEFGRAAKALTPANCRNHVLDLPQDVDVVAVEAVGHSPAPHTYLRRP